MAKWLEFTQTPQEIFIDISQFQGMQPTQKIFCRQCQCERMAFKPICLRGPKRPDKTYLVAPSWMVVKSFCSVCGWMYRKVAITPRLRMSVERLDKGQCVYCGFPKSKDVDFGLDHLTPEIDGGENTVQNLVLACQSCNSSKGRGPGRYKPRFGRFACTN